MSQVTATNGFACNETSDVSTPSKKAKLSTSELQGFDSVFPQLVQDLTTSHENHIADALVWFKQVLEYNVPHGKKNRGVAVVESLRYLCADNVSDEQIHTARVLGWCVELLQACFLVADDIMDQSETRRGRPCWYKKREIGLVAINDSLYLESALYFLLKKYCGRKAYYVQVLELFHEITLKTITGQNLDTCTPPLDGTVDFTNYTTERYHAIVTWKTAYYSFYLPVAIAMYMVGIADEDSHSKAKTILLKMGEFFQIQDDYLDCYGDPEVTGKIGTDIEDNKCSWLVVTAIQEANETQLHTLKENYAQGDKVTKVKEVYNELNLEELYKDFEENSYKEIMTLIQDGCGHLPKEMFYAFVKKIYKRDR